MRGLCRNEAFLKIKAECSENDRAVKESDGFCLSVFQEAKSDKKHKKAECDFRFFMF